MVTVIKKGSDHKEISERFEQLSQTSKQKAFDAYKFCGKLKIAEDPEDIQKRLRDEWK